MAAGRTRRKRRRAIGLGKQKTVSLSHNEIFINLIRWMKRNGFRNSKNLQPVAFSDTGRGLMTRRKICGSDIIISIPDKMLITYDTVSRSNQLRGMIDTRRVSPLEALCLYLITQRTLGENSFWSAYVRTLPEVYDTPGYWTEQELSCLPTDVQSRCQAQISVIREQFVRVSSVCDFLVTFDDYLWAWSTVNTRSIHMNDELGCALAPFLDLLNHSSRASVKAAFNLTNKCYEISSLDRFSCRDQVFIYYGPHDNQTLLVEYGFVLPDNVHGCVYFTLQELVSVAGSVDQRKREFIEKVSPSDKIFVSYDGLSWNLIIAIRVLVADVFEYKNRSVYLSTEPTISEIERMRPFIDTLLDTKLNEINSCSLRSDSCSNVYRRYMIQTLLNERKIILNTARTVMQYKLFT